MRLSGSRQAVGHSARVDVQQPQVGCSRWDGVVLGNASSTVKLRMKLLGAGEA